MLLLFDIGGTKIRVGIAENNFELLNDIIFSTPLQFEEGMETFFKSAKALIKDQKITHICGGIAGTLNSQKSQLVRSPHLPLWIGKPLQQTLQNLFQAEVFLDNDACMDGLGESVFGAGKDYTIVSYITISTGVGGAKIVAKKIDSHAVGFEPGHQIIEINGELCIPCQVKGHLEAYISGTALQKKYGKHPNEITDERVWHEVTQYLSVGLANTIVHWSPDVIVLGGSVSKHISLELLTEKLAQKITIFPVLPKIIRAQLGDLNGLYGALAYLGDKR